MELSKFSKDEAIKNHREMWLWIASEYARGVCGTVYYLKSEYVKKHFPENNLLADCFLCEYILEHGQEDCRGTNCLLCWNTEDNSCIGDNSYYVQLDSPDLSCEERAKLCMKIANLPVNERMI